MNTEIKIQQIYTNNSRIDGEIVVVDVVIEGEKDGYSSNVFASVQLNPADAANFIQLKDTTEEVVVGWVRDALGAKIGEYEAIVNDRIESQKNPLISTPLPWAATPIADIP
jgi:hypothetical protein